jgi:type I restriction enzyme S subunit
MEKHRSKKPLIRFPEFKNSWEQKQLNELLRESKKRNENLKFGKDKVLSVSGEHGIVNQIEHLGRSYAGVSVHQYHVVDTGDIVYTKSPLKENPYGIIRLNKGKPGIVSTLYAVYKPKKQTAYAPFLGYYFSLDANTNRYLRPLVKKGAKNDMKVNNEYVLNDMIFAPPLLEQKRIASFFIVLDKKLEELKQKKLLLEYYKKGVVQKIFSRKLKFKNNRGKDFPKWEPTKFGSIYSYKISNSFSREFLNFTNGKVKNIHYGDLHTRYKKLFDISHETVPFINKEINLTKIGKENYCKVGDLVIADASEDYSDIGKAIEIVNLKNQKVVAGLHTILARPDKNKLHLGFGGYLMDVEYVKMQICMIAQGTKVLGLSSRRLSEIEIMLPSKDEQKRITDFLKAIDNKLITTSLQVQQIELYRKGLLQKMFC